jgi:hypothetical protein
VTLNGGVRLIVDVDERHLHRRVEHGGASDGPLGVV